MLQLQNLCNFQGTYKTLFLNYYNVLITLNIRAYVKDTRIQMELKTAQNLINGLENENESK